MWATFQVFTFVTLLGLLAAPWSRPKLKEGAFGWPWFIFLPLISMPETLCQRLKIIETPSEVSVICLNNYCSFVPFFQWFGYETFKYFPLGCLKSRCLFPLAPDCICHHDSYLRKQTARMNEWKRERERISDMQSRVSMAFPAEQRLFQKWLPFRFSSPSLWVFVPRITLQSGSVDVSHSRWLSI